MEQHRIIIAIDGYSSCGKSTLAKALAKELGYAYVDSGAMYRAVTLFFLNNNINIEDEAQIMAALDVIEIRFKSINRNNHTFLNGEDVEDKIREMRVSDYVSPVSTLPLVRKALVKMQQAMGRHKGLVMDGRDIGTVVFKEAELKIFMTADTDIRAHRRLLEMREKGNSNVDFKAVVNNLSERDRIDSTRKDSPLRQADGAIELNNTHLSHDEQFYLALGFAYHTLAKQAFKESGVEINDYETFFQK
jgi:CMP/dCMP kinase